MRPPFHRRPVARTAALAFAPPPESPDDELARAARSFGRAIVRSALRLDGPRRAASAVLSLLLAVWVARAGLGGAASWLAEIVGSSVALPLACVAGAFLVRGVERLVGAVAPRAVRVNVRRAAPGASATR